MAFVTAYGNNNDLRGWILCIVSGIGECYSPAAIGHTKWARSCVLGASIICIDIILQLLPGKKDFRIQDSNNFLACSLSLSFGVMIFMSLYSMLPEAREYLKKAEYGEQTASLILVGCFVGGFVGIQILSRLFHQFLPSHVVDCDHSHEEHFRHGSSYSGIPGLSRRSSRARSVNRGGHRAHLHNDSPRAEPDQTDESEDDHAHDSSPLLGSRPSLSLSQPGARLSTRRARSVHIDPAAILNPKTRSRSATTTRRPSVLEVPKRVVSFMKDTKTHCDELGPCYGYSDPCGQECFKHISSSRSNSRATFLRTNTSYGGFNMDTVEENSETNMSQLSPTGPRSRAHSHASHMAMIENGDFSDDDYDPETQHHHHVAENAFLSIGLQTSIAIALHKFPEGFITYATNHANPALGFSVFLALFVHNISEGFALALPLYMALNSRVKAIAWSSLLGGLSQPLGATIAFAWFQLADRTHIEPSAVVYGCLFAATSGIMVSVALQLFVESLSLNHNKNLSILFAFLGMTLLGLSNAFTSDVH
ncbi:Zinc/iron permease [Xylariaceae sp. FL0594]|nr:Zinc/iron permease [Xylariaceae sp. FL0594]